MKRFTYGLLRLVMGSVWGRFRGLFFPVLLVLLTSGIETYSQLPVVRVRFANPAYDCQTGRYCLDVQFQSDTPGQVMFGMNVRFVYDDAVLDFVELNSFQGGYGLLNQIPPDKKTGALTSSAMFGFTGPMEFINGAVQLNDKALPVVISTSGWTTLFSACFRVLDPAVAFNKNSFCPSVVWDLEYNPQDGGFMPGDDGVVITVMENNPLTIEESSPVSEEVVMLNWSYDGVQPDPPYGSPQQTAGGCTPGDLIPPVITTTAENRDLGCNPDLITVPVFSATDNCDALVTPVVTTDGPVHSGCLYSQTWTANAVDAMGNAAIPVSITWTWKQDTELPVITTADTDHDLGCNPATIVIPNFTGTDNCEGIFNPVVTTSGATSQGCVWSQTWTANYTDQCGNKALPVSVTVTWTIDTTPPVISGCPATALELGINPVKLPDCEDAKSLVTVTDGCGGLTTLTCQAGDVVSNGCSRRQTFTLTATDGCGNTSGCSVVYTWTEDNGIPQFVGCPTAPIALGCNPVLPVCSDALKLVTVLDGCTGSLIPVCTPGQITENGCSRSQDFTLVATSNGGKTATCVVSFSWTEDKTIPVLTTLAVNRDLGCNPVVIAPEFTGTDNCEGTILPVVTTTGVTNQGVCGRLQTWTASYTDKCGNVAQPVSITYTWTEDKVIPEVTTLATNRDLGCNPVIVPPVFTGSDNCEGVIVPVVSTTGSINTGGCSWSQTWTATYTDKCGNAAQPVSITWSWTEDVTPPVITGCPVLPVDLGLNPKLPTCEDAAGLITVTDGCSGLLTPSCTAGAVISDGCKRTQTFTLTATDGCGNTAGCTVTFTWITGLPEFVNCPAAPIDLGCNPQWPVCSDALALVTVKDGCGGTLIPVCTPGEIIQEGCKRGQVFTLVATSSTGQSATCTVTFTWTKDQVLPVITTTAQSGSLGCNPGTITPPVFTGTDDCEGVIIPVVSTTGPVHTGCAWSQTWTANYTDKCGNKALPVSITWSWTQDGVPPVLTTQAVSRDLGCNPVVVAPVFGGSDDCEGTVVPVVTTVGPTGPACARTQTWTAVYTDGCGNTSAPVSITYTWKEDLIPPDFIVPADVTIASDQNCNYDARPEITGWPTGVTDNCTATPSVGYTEVVAAGPVAGTRLLTRTWTATDGCQNKTTKVQRVTITGGSPPELNLHDHCVYLTQYGTWTLNSTDIAQITAGSTGGCGIGKLTFTLSPRSFNCNQAGKQIPVLVTAVDGAGNTATGTVKVTVADTLAPVAICKDVTVTLDASGQAYVTQNLVNNGSYDNCSVSGVFMDKQLFTRMNIGVNEVLLVVKDPSGNAGTCNAKVTVLDTPKLGLNVVNKAPTVSDVAEVKIVNEPLSLDIPLSNITSGDETGVQKVISVTAGSDNPTLIKGLEVIYTPGSTTGKLMVTIATGVSGSAQITLTVKDDGGTANGGVDTVSKTFKITVENTGSQVNVTVFDGNGIAAVTSVTDIGGELMAKLWPNPTRGPVNIELTWNDIRKVDVSVYNVLGVEVYRNQYSTGELIRFDLGEKASGVYMVKIMGEGRTVVKKVTLDRR